MPESKLLPTYKMLEIAVPRRVDCAQDEYDARDEFERQFNLYLGTHALAELRGGYGYRLIPRNHIDFVSEDDKRRLSQLFPNDDRIASAIPMGALLNRYAGLVSAVKELLETYPVPEGQEWKIENLKYEYLGQRKPEPK